MPDIADHVVLVETYRDDASRDELAAALLVARILAATVDAAAVRDRLDALATEYRAAGGQDAAALVDFLREAGFCAASDPQSLDCSRIDLVVARRRGIPISLGIVYLMVGRRLGFDTRGVNFPGHFLARIDGTLVDPLRGRCVEPDECLGWLTDANLHRLGDTAFALASPDMIALRMLNNVKAIQVARADFVAALDTIDCQLPLTNERAALQLERADYWSRLGDAAAAVAVLESSRADLSGSAWQHEVEARLKQWSRRTPRIVH
jgi:regulator of sirC expression with transglutaminase-like and TPR domain